MSQSNVMYVRSGDFDTFNTGSLSTSTTPWYVLDSEDKWKPYADAHREMLANESLLKVIRTHADWEPHLRRVQIEWTPKVSWYLLPAIEFNISLGEIGINFLCLGIYIKYKK